MSLSILTASFAQTNFNQYGSTTLLNSYGNVTGGGAIINSLNNRENTRGTRFMFNRWLKGTVIDVNGIVINSDSLGFNFDKQEDNLLIKRDASTMISVNSSQVKEFTLSDNNNSYRFTRIDAIDSSKLLLALVEIKDKYSLYKSVKTKFVKANYQTNGISESGHEYDEYVDQNNYYLLQPGNAGYKVIDLKAKSIKSAFTNKSKVYDYFGQHIDDTIDENFLVGLVNYMNQ